MISYKALDANGELINSKMTPFTYPAGEVSIKFEDSRKFEQTELAVLQFEKGSIHDDLVKYLMWDEVMNNNTYRNSHDLSLILPYMPGAREDRGRVFGLQTYMKILETSVGVDNVVVFDPHSDVTNLYLKAWGLESTTKINILSTADLVRQRPWAFGGYDYVIAPDEGATERAQSVADVLGVPVVQVKKARDFETGKITGLIAPEIDDTKKYLVIDDLCDGGRTFTLLSDNLGLPKEQIDLFVSHGVFSKGTAELEKKFGRIITTNSYLSDAVLDGVLRKNSVEVLDVIHPMIDLIK